MREQKKKRWSLNKIIASWMGYPFVKKIEKRYKGSKLIALLI